MIIDHPLPFGAGLSPMLEGAYAPIRGEFVHENLPVIGEIPKDFSGGYYRNGPNARFEPNGRYHWFDGDGMVHAALFDRGKLTYRNAYVTTDAFNRESEGQAALYYGVAETQKDRLDKPIKDSGNTDLIGHSGRLLASWYLAGDVYGLDPQTLATTGKVKAAKGLNHGFSAHCKVDPVTSELMFFDYGIEAPYLSYGVLDAQGSLTHLIPIPLAGPRLPHDMAITRNYSILMDLPLFYEAEALAAGRHKIMFYPELPTRFAVVPRHGSVDQIRWFEASPCFIYHVVNAYETGDEIVLTACRYLPPVDANGRIDGPRMAKMIAFLKMDARLWRYRFNLKTGTCTEESIDPDQNGEFPVINIDYTGQPNQFGYVCAMDVADATPQFHGLMKYHLGSGQKQSYSDGPGVYYSEPQFAPKDQAKAEDDGYLISMVHNQNNNQSQIQIFDATAIEQGPVARVLMPHRIPAGFHGTWMKAGDGGR